MRDEEVKAEHFTNDNRSDGTNLVMCFDFSIWNIATLNAYWQTVYVYARSIHYARTLQDSTELLKFFQAQAILNEPATASVINFPTVVKTKGLLNRKF